MNIHSSIDSLIGHTPLFFPARLQSILALPAKLLLKLEGANPAGSAKDRVALSMLDAAERDGEIASGATIIEPTSGNTGIGLCAICASRGYRTIIVMPDNMSVERIRLMQAFGAEVVLTPAALGMKGAIQKAEELANKIPGSFIPGQFENPANPDAHYCTTGPEIYADTNGKVDLFVCGVGTGGTITGCGRYLKEQKPTVRVIAVEPASSPLLSEGRAGAHGLQGIGANFIPATLDRSIYDDIVTVTEQEAYAAARALAHNEGLLVGISSGAALHAAIKLAKQPENTGKTIVALLPDSGERYLSTDLFQEK